MLANGCNKTVREHSLAPTEEAQPIQGTADLALPVRQCRPLEGMSPDIK